MSMRPGGLETVALIEEACGEAFFVRVDVSNPEDCEALVRKTVEKFGPAFIRTPMIAALEENPDAAEHACSSSSDRPPGQP
jgi:NAD(P)-dependent dehydrogenase (short-subunit alcohol dehydrogenase family)